MGVGCATFCSDFDSGNLAHVEETTTPGTASALGVKKYDLYVGGDPVAPLTKDYFDYDNPDAAH